MPRHDGASEYRKVAQHRLHDAQELLEAPTLSVKVGNPETRHQRGAMYLAGYAVECILKAYIISRNSPSRTLAEVAPDLVTNVGHNLDRLLLRAGLEGSLGERLRDWQLCRTWTPEWRYEPGIPSRGEAKNFVDAACRIHSWVRTMI